MKNLLSLIIMLSSGVAIVVLPSYVLHKIEHDEKNAEPPVITVKVKQVTDKLHSPTAVTFPGNGDMWVTEQPGQIRIIKNGKLLQEPLLDLSSKMLRVNKGYEERGLLGICLHPKFN